jgi:hypothetical protein
MSCCLLRRWDLGSEQAGEFGHMLDEDPAMMERRQQCFKRLELYKSARDEVDSVAWGGSSR